MDNKFQRYTPSFDKKDEVTYHDHKNDYRKEDKLDDSYDDCDICRAIIA